MIDVAQITQYAWAVALAWVGYVHREMNTRPTREELILRLENISTKVDYCRLEIKELKDRYQDKTES